MPGVRCMGPRQTVTLQNLVSVCLQDFYSKYNNENVHQTLLKLEMDSSN